MKLRLFFFRPTEGLLARKYLRQKPCKGKLLSVHLRVPSKRPRQLMQALPSSLRSCSGVTKLQRAADVGLLRGMWTTWMAPFRKLWLRPTA